jgi:hypothetical protein
MGVRVDDPGQYRSACGINDYGLIRNPKVSRPSNGDDAIAVNSHQATGDGLGTGAVNYGPIGYDERDRLKLFARRRPARDQEGKQNRQRAIAYACSDHLPRHCSTELRCSKMEYKRGWVDLLLGAPGVAKV